MERFSSFVKRVLEVLLELEVINTSLKLEQINTLKPEQINELLKFEQINMSLEPQKTYTLQELEQINTLLKLKRTDTILSLACTCKTILEICKKECEDRLLTSDPPNNIFLILYKSIQKWYLCKNSSTPLRCTVSSLLHCPIEKKTRLTLSSREFKLDNLTTSYPKHITLCLYNVGFDELVSQTSDNEVHTLTLCDCPGTINLFPIFITFTSLTKLKLIRTRLIGNPSIRSSTPNLITLSIIECDMTQFHLNDWISQLLKLQKLKCENNIYKTVDPTIELSSSINSISITHTKSGILLINTSRCGREVFIK
jgi:hypothetical protein